MPVPRRAGLGRGLSALIPGGQTETVLEEIPVSQIRPNPHQPRIVFDEESLVTLAESIRAVGLLQPVLVRPAGAAYELIAGERRWRAAQRAGLANIPAMVRSAEDASILEQALIENLHREDLNPLEEASAYQQLIDDFGLTHDDVGQRVGRSRSAVTNSLRLLGLPGPVQAHLASAALSAGHARALLALGDAREQTQLAETIRRDGLSVRATEQEVARRLEKPRRDQPEGAGPPPEKSRSLLEVESRLGDLLQTRVVVEQGRGGRGRVMIEFGSADDLGRIFQVLTRAAAPPP